ncbi:MAG TPA: NAD(P)H-hydrate dehydratase [Brevundimonas sp.]|jgi:hydroxyethylthiazole kinase-like uncharacterized protein yjeF
MIAVLDVAALSACPLPRLPVDGDKEDRGSLFVMGGETVMAGAALLAGVAALRVGAGKLQLAATSDAVAAMSVAVPEARIVRKGAAGGLGKKVRAAARKASALVIGPGMDARPRQRRMALNLLREAPFSPALIDAGALPEAKEASVFAALSNGRVILTPHAGEMAGMLGRDKAAVKADPLATAREASAMFRSVVVMKGVETFVVSPDGLAWQFKGGVAGLGTSGSGDVLAGVIGGLLARGASPVTAALWGVVLHAEAGAALSEHAPLGFLARDLLEPLPGLLGRLGEASAAA